MGRSLKYEIPGVDPRRSLAEVAATGWRAQFDKSRDAVGGRADDAEDADDADDSDDADAGPRPRVLEIGFGRGEFLLAMAADAPDVDFVGVEVSFKRTLKMARKVARAKLGNVLLLEARAEIALERLFRPDRLQAIWVNFSDPWPKARHAHRRLLQPPFVAAAARAIAPGGLLYVATDDVRYAHQIDGVLAAEPALVNHYAPWPYLHEVPGRAITGYEAQWRAEGRPLHFFAYAKLAGGAGPR